MKKRDMSVLLGLLLGFSLSGPAQTAQELIAGVKAKIDKVNDYEAKGIMKTNVVFMKAPAANVKIYFKKPNKLRIKNESGMSFIPKGSVNINPAYILAGPGSYDILDAGKEDITGLRIIKLLPKDENAEMVLSTLYIDEKQLLVKRTKTTTKEEGTYELAMTYGQYAEYGLPDKVIFSFNTKDYKLPKGVTFDYDDGSKKQSKPVQASGNKGTVEILYTSFTINKGVPDTLFQ